MEYTLRRGHLTAMASSHGGELVSFQDHSGREYLWQGNPDYWAGRNPNLFPIVGSLKDGTIHVNGVPYHMNRHGFARTSDFTLAESGEDFAVFELTENPSTLQQFPYRFHLRIRHQLLDNGFFTQFEVSNPDTTPLPFCIGAHTAFNCPMQADKQFKDYRLVFDRAEDAYAHFPSAAGCLAEDRKEYTLQNTNVIPLDHQVYTRVDTLIFEGLMSTGVSLLGPDGHGIHMEFSVFPMIAFWTNGAKAAPYICLEPWHGCAAFEDESGEFRDKHHCMILEPDQAKTLRYTVTLV